MKNFLCILILFLSCLLIVPVDGSAADSVQAPVWNNSNTIKNIKPEQTNTQRQMRSPVEQNEKQRQSIAFKSATIKRNSIGEWLWEVKIKATQNRQVAAGTAKVRVWQNTGGKKTLLETRTYDRPINPEYGILSNSFFPSDLSDTLYFELIQLTPSTGGSNLSTNTKKVVDQATAEVPPYDIQLINTGYDSYSEPGYLHATLKNDSTWPIKVHVVMRAGVYEHWTTIRHKEVVLLKGGGETVEVRKDWPFTKKGGGYYFVSVNIALLDQATGKVKWTEIKNQKGVLPTYH